MDQDSNTEDPEVALQIAKNVREYGNQLFKEGEAEEALQKYQSGLFLQVFRQGKKIFDLLSHHRIHSVS